MQFARLLITLLVSPIWIVAADWLASPFLLHQKPLTPIDAQQDCNCTGIESTTANTTYHICNNATLGPQVLPWRLPLLSLVNNYDRFGGLSPRAFLDRWCDLSGSRPSWIYPPFDGFQLDVHNKPINATMILRAGSKVDRFGEETGKFVAAADATFAQRALPPDALNICKSVNQTCAPSAYPWSYHIYNVTVDFQVSGGPIAAAFGQPGGGMQYLLPDRVINLVKNGILAPLRFKDVIPGPGKNGKCGWKPANCSCERPQ